MNNLRLWPGLRGPLPIAADARYQQTDFFDDQVWEIEIGKGDQPAISLHTRYGGRVGLATIVPIWMHENQMIYQARTYRQVPRIRRFSPGYVDVMAQLLRNVSLRAQHIALDSHALGGIYSVKNSGTRPITLRMDLFGHVGLQGQEEPLAIVENRRGDEALAMGQYGEHFAPLVLIEGGTATKSSSSASPKVSIDLTLDPEETRTIRWIAIGKQTIYQSLAAARNWFTADWETIRKQINVAAQAIPQIHTGNEETDMVLAVSINRLLQSVFRQAGVFPDPTFSMGRLPAYGFSRNGDGSDFPRMLAGQEPTMTYLLLPLLATVETEIAEGILNNYFTMQGTDGAIDGKPSPSGATAGYMCLPILARLTWNLYRITRDREWVDFAFTRLEQYFERWLQQDADGDGFPEWQTDHQTGYFAFPTFAPTLSWSQGADISTAETPDLLGYLLSEAEALRHMAELLDDTTAIADYDSHIQQLHAQLANTWTGEYYAYHDRDTNITTSGSELLQDGAGDEEHIIDRALLAPNRLIVNVIGGARLIPTVDLRIVGRDAEGNEISEEASDDDFIWQTRIGVYTSQTVFSHVTSVHCRGLSRVYRVHVNTMDTTKRDINTLLPLIVESLPADRTSALIDLALSDRYRRPNGITMTDTKGEFFDPANADGAGGVWFYWQTLLSEALLRNGHSAAVQEMVQRQLHILYDILERGDDFGQFYHSDIAESRGEKGHLSGVAPLKTVLELIGVYILSSSQVHIRQGFHWGTPVMMKQHGVEVRRSDKQLKVHFPSGHTVELDPSLEHDTILTDPNPVATPHLDLIRMPEVEALQPPPPPPEKRVIIEVEIDE